MRKPAVLVGAFALTIALAGCGSTVSGHPRTGSDGAGSTGFFSSALDLYNASSQQTDKSKSAKFTVSSAMGGQQITGQGSGNFDGADSQMQMSMTVGPMQEELRYLDNTMYMQVPEQYRAQLTSGKPWGKASPDSAIGKQMGAAQAQNNDPRKMLEQIKDAGTIKSSEKTTLDGQEVTHYVIDLDFDKAMAKLADAGGLPEAQLEQLKGKVPPIPVEVWLNSDQLPVQLTEDMSGVLKATGAPAAMSSMKMTMKYTDWGAPVSVEAPPADQVGELKIPG